MIKYGTYVVYRCNKCKKEVEIPYHLLDQPPLEKYASYCEHGWEKIGDKIYNEDDTEKSENL